MERCSISRSIVSLPPLLLRRDLQLIQFLIVGIHPKAELPKYVPRAQTFMMQAKRSSASSRTVANSAAPAYGKRKVVLFATCLVNWNKPDIGLASLDVLAHNGVETAVAFPGCCGMPQLEHGNVKG